jgi:hypothetical protein
LVEVFVNPEQFECGVTILELEPNIENVTADVIDVRWLNSKPELQALTRMSHKNFRLFVKDGFALEKTRLALGQPIEIDSSVLNSAKIALNRKKLYNWRGFTQEIGLGISRSILTRISAEAIRRGESPNIAMVAKSCLLDGVNPIDADVFLRLKVLKG